MAALTGGDRGDEIVALLTEMRDLQKQALANQAQSIAQQQVSIARQQAHLRLYVGVIVLVLPLVAALGFVAWRLAAPHL